MKLIDKDALVAEIDRILGSLTDAAFDSMIGKNLQEVKDFINSFETKEVDLEKEIDDYVNDHFSECEDGVLLSDDYSKELTLLDVAPMARYFAQWQKGQMMKDAIDAEVYGVQLILQDGMPKGLSDNDKVKVIIIKE